MKTNRTLFEQIGGTYTQTGGFLLPDLDVEECEPIGKYGRMRKRYLKEHRSILFNTMLLSGKLFQHLSEIDCACKERIELLTRQMAQREGVFMVFGSGVTSHRVSGDNNQKYPAAVRRPRSDLSHRLQTSGFHTACRSRSGSQPASDHPR